MIDTIAFRPDWPAILPVPSGLIDVGPVKCRFDNLGRLGWLQVSLPRLLHGSNGTLLASQDDLDRALDGLRQELSKVVAVPPVEIWPIPARLDLAWHLDCQEAFGVPVQSIVRAYAETRIPGIQEPGVLRTNSVTWQGSQWTVILYGKSRQLRVGDGVLRAEVRLTRKGAFRKHLGDRSWRDIDELWRTFRNAMVSLPGIPKPIPSRSLEDAIGRCVPRAYHGAILGTLAGIRSSRSVREVSRRISQAACGAPEGVDWSSVLPLEMQDTALQVAPAPRAFRAGTTSAGYPRNARQFDQRHPLPADAGSKEVFVLDPGRISKPVSSETRAYGRSWR